MSWMPKPSDRRVLMVPLRYRMENRQLCKLYIKYLQFCIRHGRARAAVLEKGFGEVQEAGNALCQRQSCKDCPR